MVDCWHGVFPNCCFSMLKDRRFTLWTATFHGVFACKLRDFIVCKRGGDFCAFVQLEELSYLAKDTGGS